MDRVQQLQEVLAQSLGSARLRGLDGDDPRFASHGEVTSLRGIYARTGIPERGGLLCAKIFGTVRPQSCICTKYSGPEYLGITREKCGVLVAEVSIRRQRFGHLSLPRPVPHPWDPSRTLQRLRVLPAGYREPSPKDAERGDLSGLSGLYQRVLRHSQQTARCLEHAAPSIIIERETAELTATVARLFGTPHRRPTKGPTLADHIGRALLDVRSDGPPSDELLALLACVELTLG